MPIVERECPKCNKIKPVFYVHKLYKSSPCDDCRKIKNRNIYINHNNKYKATHEEYYKKYGEHYRDKLKYIKLMKLQLEGRKTWKGFSIDFQLGILRQKLGIKDEK